MEAERTRAETSSQGTSGEQPDPNYRFFWELVRTPFGKAQLRKNASIFVHTRCGGRRMYNSTYHSFATTQARVHSLTHQMLPCVFAAHQCTPFAWFIFTRETLQCSSISSNSREHAWWDTWTLGATGMAYLPPYIIHEPPPQENFPPLHHRKRKCQLKLPLPPYIIERARIKLNPPSPYLIRKARPSLLPRPLHHLQNQAHANHPPLHHPAACPHGALLSIFQLCQNLNMNTELQSAFLGIIPGKPKP